MHFLCRDAIFRSLFHGVVATVQFSLLFFRSGIQADTVFASSHHYAMLRSTGTTKTLQFLAAGSMHAEHGRAHHILMCPVSAKYFQWVCGYACQLPGDGWFSGDSWTDPKRPQLFASSFSRERGKSFEVDGFTLYVA